MKRVVIESPFGRNVDGSKCTPEQYARNTRYLKRCIADSLHRLESPYASHRFFPGVLDDTIAEERKLGIDAGLEWGACADFCVAYVDHGTTEGMQIGIDRYTSLGLPFKKRLIGPEPMGQLYREDGAKLVVEVVSDSSDEDIRTLNLRCLEVIRPHRSGSMPIGQVFEVRGRIGAECYWPWRLEEP